MYTIHDTATDEIVSMNKDVEVMTVPIESGRRTSGRTIGPASCRSVAVLFGAPLLASPGNGLMDTHTPRP